MSRMTIRPFEHFVQKGHAFCPMCGWHMGKADKIRRKLCRGKFVVIGTRCPRGDHFHHSCPQCFGEWCEATYERLRSEVSYSLAVALNLARESGLPDEDVLNLVRELMVRDVMTS